MNLYRERKEGERSKGGMKVGRAGKEGRGGSRRKELTAFQWCPFHTGSARGFRDLPDPQCMMRIYFSSEFKKPHLPQHHRSMRGPQFPPALTRSPIKRSQRPRAPGAVSVTGKKKSLMTIDEIDEKKKNDNYCALGRLETQVYNCKLR